MSKIRMEDFILAFKDREPGLIGSYNYYSVLVPLVEKDDELHILYEVRSDNLTKQPGEVCFPGGRMEKGETPEQCAIRETSEELNISENDIKVIAQMDYMHTYSNFTMYAFLGTIDYEVLKKTTVNPDEVKEIFMSLFSIHAEKLIGIGAIEHFR
jgi:coenzyme A diphosphatase NUDT7